MTGSFWPSPDQDRRKGQSFELHLLIVKDLKLNVTKGRYHSFHTCCPIHAGCQDPESTDIQLRFDNRRKQYSISHETSHAASCSGQSDDLVITLGPHSAAALVLGDLLGHSLGPGVVVVVVVGH